MTKGDGLEAGLNMARGLADGIAAPCARCVARGVGAPPPATTTVKGFDGAEREVCHVCAEEHAAAVAQAGAWRRERG